MKAEITAAMKGSATATLAAVTGYFNIYCSKLLQDVQQTHNVNVSYTQSVMCFISAVTSELAIKCST